jgi:hypothetical protein
LDEFPLPNKYYDTEGKKSEEYFFIAEKAVGVQLIIDFMYWLGGFRELDILYECTLFL